MDIEIVEVSEGFTPAYKHATDSCADCMANIDSDVTIAPRGMVTIPLGFKIGVPVGYEAQIRPRSGLARKNGVVAVLGTIDSGFTGEVTTTLINNLDAPFVIHRGDRVCQMKISESKKIYFHKVSVLPDSERGENGWGSTGI